MMWDELLTLIFPEQCVGCEKSGSILCALCERMLITKPTALSPWSAALFEYHHPIVKKALWALKYHRKRAIGKYFGVALYREFFKQLVHKGKTEEEIIVIPVPASKKAVAMRGYNHSAIIAASIAAEARIDGLQFIVRTNILQKKKENVRQVEARGKKAREENVAQIFTVQHGEDITGKTVVLIDDVITTGATVSAARRTLKEWKPKRILAIAVAH